MIHRILGFSAVLFVIAAIVQGVQVQSDVRVLQQNDTQLEHEYKISKQRKPEIIIDSLPSDLNKSIQNFKILTTNNVSTQASSPNNQYSEQIGQNFSAFKNSPEIKNISEPQKQKETPKIYQTSNYLSQFSKGQEQEGDSQSFNRPVIIQNTSFFDNPQIIHSSQLPLQIFSGNQYSLAIAAKSYKIITLKGTQAGKSVHLSYSSSKQFTMCFTSANSHQCSSAMYKYAKRQGFIEIKADQLNNPIKIFNPHLIKNNQITLSFHQNADNCYELLSQKVYNQPLYAQNCFSFTLREQAQNATLLLQRQGMIQLKYRFLICNSQSQLPLVQWDHNRVTLSESSVKQKCKNQAKKTLKVKIDTNTIPGQSKRQQTSIIVALDYDNHPVTLSQGLLYAKYLTPLATFRTFQYTLQSIDDTQISVFSQQPLQIYINIANKGQQTSAPTPNHFDLSSKTGFIFTYFRPYLIVKKKDLVQHKCIQCILIISVYLHNYGADLKSDIVSIQMTQTVSILRQGRMKHHFLPKDSIAYYQYSTPSEHNLFVQLSDNHKNCAKMYISDQQAPGPANYLTKSITNQLSLIVNPQKRYYVAVKALEDCAYSIVAYTQATGVTVIEYGRLGRLEMKEGQSNFFMFKGTKGKYIKVLGLHQYGNIQIYLNRTSLSQLYSTNVKQLNMAQFQTKGQYPNSLLLTQQSSKWCQDCYYLLGITAIKHTSSSLFVGTQSTPLPISHKTISDILPQRNDITLGEYYGSSIFNLQIKVMSGRLKVEIKHQQQSYSRQVAVGEDLNQKVDVKGKGTGLGMLDLIVDLFVGSPVSVRFQALQDNTVYSARFEQKNEKSQEISHIQTKNSDKLQQIVKQNNFSKTQNQTGRANITKKVGLKQFNLTAGHSIATPLYPNQTNCFNGYFRDKYQKILISSDYPLKNKLKLLQLNSTINLHETQTHLETVQNIITLSFPMLLNYKMTKATTFNICATYTGQQEFWVTVVQAQNFTVLPPETDILVRGEFIFVAHPQTDLILDVFQCKDKTQVTYSQDRQQLDTTPSKNLDLIGLANQPHAIRSTQHSTTFFKVKGKLAVVRWFAMDMQKGIGTGYLDYGVVHPVYKSNFLGLSLTLETLRQLKEANTIIVDANYTLYISDSQEKLNTASHCQILADDQVLRMFNIVPQGQKMNLSQSVTVKLNKTLITETFGKDGVYYMMVVADVVLQRSSNLTKSQSQSDSQPLQRYRYFYPMVEMGGSLLTINYLQTLSFLQIMTLLVLSLLIIVILYYICSRKCMVMLGTLKNRVLVQQQAIGQEDKVGTQAMQEMMRVPASSDRRRVTGSQLVQEKDNYDEAK